AAAAAAPQSVERSAGRPKRAAAAASESKLGEECDDAPVAKRERTKRDWAAADEYETPAAKRTRNHKESEKPLLCPQCDKACKSSHSFITHLHHAHQTTPKKLGLVFLCKCGHETVSDFHGRFGRCRLSKSTVIINARDSKNYRTEDMGTEASEDNKV
ncbi:hypothetical protein PFISCL1PPCAC_23075, partial [Pristionchus fissidentatus]